MSVRINNKYFGLLYILYSRFSNPHEKKVEVATASCRWQHGAYGLRTMVF